jgi:hypothetical protein
MLLPPVEFVSVNTSPGPACAALSVLTSDEDCAVESETTGGVADPPDEQAARIAENAATDKKRVVPNLKDSSG